MSRPANVALRNGINTLFLVEITRIGGVCVGRTYTDHPETYALAASIDVARRAGTKNGGLNLFPAGIIRIDDVTAHCTLRVERRVAEAARIAERTGLASPVTSATTTANNDAGEP
jgi:hypothetical protein